MHVYMLKFIYVICFEFNRNLHWCTELQFKIKMKEVELEDKDIHAMTNF